MCGILNLGLLLLLVEILFPSMPVIDAAPRWSFMKLHAQLNLTQHEHLDTPLVELIPELADVTPEAIRDCHQSIHSPNSSHSALFVPGALLRDVLHEFYSFYDEKSITNRQITRVLEILKVIVQHVLKCNPHLQKGDIHYRKPRWKAGLNAVTDREFHHLVNMNHGERFRKMGQQSFGNCEGPVTPVQNLPRWFDMREMSPNVVGYIRNQGQCGSCWAHAVIGSAEAAIVMAGYPNISPLSPQYHTDFDDKNLGCNGGMGAQALEWAVNNGFVSEASYPYVGENSPGNRPQAEYSVSGYCYKLYATSLEERKQLVHTHGGLYIGILVDVSLETYQSGIYTSNQCNDPESAHHVTMIGYGDDYILIKNSWGAEWGDGGTVMFDPYACEAPLQTGYLIV